MRHWAPFVAAYAAIVVLVLAGSPLAQETTETVPTETVETVETVTTPTTPTTPTTTAEAPPPVTTETVPVQTVPVETVPVQTVPAEPEPQPKKKKRKPVARAAADGSVTIQDFAFAPNEVTVNVGDSVTWTNQDSVEHTATADDGSFDTGLLGEGESGSVTFDEAGTFAYFCEPHPNMRGTITVQASGSQGGGGGGGSDDTGDSGAAGGDTGSSSSGTTGSSSGDTLPSTGADDVVVLAVLGVLMLALGFVTRGRAAQPAPRLPGRSGW